MSFDDLKGEYELLFEREVCLFRISALLRIVGFIRNFFNI